ncbi:hypothetical protein [Streptomyces sp. NPDC047706]
MTDGLAMDLGEIVRNPMVPTPFGLMVRAVRDVLPAGPPAKNARTQGRP